MEKMLRTFLSLLIALSLTGTAAGQSFPQTATHFAGTDLIAITICSADQTAKTIWVDQNGSKVPEPIECDCPNCMQCLFGSAYKLPDTLCSIELDRTVILKIIPLSFDRTDASHAAPATARAPPHKV
ncbi:hypothetical protein [Thalassospira sp. HJ]|uniref:hypothetical protein n=1 Tax=Thalassospira sp. HJ TaxID=1616823 RepID=UPI000A46A5FC|nr:hypothetical protein [Thalassospira sp. HJ]